MSELTGRVALVTGGGRGLGQAICRMLAGSGAAVIVADVRGELAKEAAGELRAAGAAAEAMALDVADEGQAAEAIEATVARHGRLDVLVNNAGVDVTTDIASLSVEEWDRVLNVNLRGPFLMSKYALAAMSEPHSGHSVKITSTAAKRAWANASAYHASKWGLLGFSHALHVEARALGVKVTAVVAGGMRTPFLLDRFEGIDEGTLQDPRNVAETVRFVLTQPDETVIPEIMVLPMRETSWP